MSELDAEEQQGVEARTPRERRPSSPVLSAHEHAGDLALDSHESWPSSIWNATSRGAFHRCTSCIHARNSHESARTHEELAGRRRAFREDGVSAADSEIPVGARIGEQPTRVRCCGFGYAACSRSASRPSADPSAHSSLNGHLSLVSDVYKATV